MIRTTRAMTVGVIVTLLVGLIAFGSGWVAARAAGTTPFDAFIASFGTAAARQATPSEVREEFAVFWEVWHLVEGEFYHPTPLVRQTLVYGAIRGMLGTLDDEFTTFQAPELAAQNREAMQGKFEGIGAYLRFVDGVVQIDRPIKGSPAARADLRAGDTIVAVDGQPLAQAVAGLDAAAATAKTATLIRGPKGSIVTLTLRRPPAETTFAVAITRDEVPVVTVNAEMLTGGVAYIQITEFKATTTQLLDEALREIVPQHPTSIVLDLRNNPGGFLTTAQEVLGRFYDGVALYEQENGGVLKELKTILGPADLRLYEVPMVVLINGGSASAAEIVAGALHDVRPHTSLLGERSFGKGSVQNIHQLRDGSSARITVAHWLTPSRTEIHRIGITPEHQVSASEESQYAVPCVVARRPPQGQTTCSDAQLAGGLTLLAGTVSPP